MADDAGKPRRRAPAGDDAVDHVTVSERGAARRDGEIGCEDELEAAREGASVYGRDRRERCSGKSLDETAATADERLHRTDVSEQSRTLLLSAPAQKEEPVPVSTSARVVGSAVASSSQCSRPSITSEPQALARSGRAMRAQDAAPRRSTTTAGADVDITGRVNVTYRPVGILSWGSCGSPDSNEQRSET